MKMTKKEYKKLEKKLNDLMNYASRLKVVCGNKDYAEFKIKIYSAYRILDRSGKWVEKK